jgi:hypothetical protein
MAENFVFWDFSLFVLFSYAKFQILAAVFSCSVMLLKMITSHLHNKHQADLLCFFTENFWNTWRINDRMALTCNFFFAKLNFLDECHVNEDITRDNYVQMWGRGAIRHRPNGHWEWRFSDAAFDRSPPQTVSSGQL